MVQAVSTPPTSTVNYLGRSLVDSSSKENMPPPAPMNKVCPGRLMSVSMLKLRSCSHCREGVTW